MIATSHFSHLGLEKPYPKISKNLRIACLVQYSSFGCLAKLPFCVCLVLNRWKVEIILIHLNIWCWLSDSTKGVFCSSCTDPSLAAISMIFLFETIYLDVAAQEVSDPWTKYITALRRSSWLMVTRRRKWNCGVFMRPGLRDFYGDNPYKE